MDRVLGKSLQPRKQVIFSCCQNESKSVGFLGAVTRVRQPDIGTLKPGTTHFGFF